MSDLAGKVLLKAEDLHKSYKKGTEEIRAVNGINLEVKKGEILVIVGQSGAGKSTLLHVLGGLHRPTEGAVFLDGTDLYRVSDSRRARIRNERIGFIFQLYHLLPEFTVLENTLLPALMRRGTSMLGTGPIGEKDRAKEILERVGLKNRMGHKPNELSGGEAQRVAIARALINEPDIVFCDEPTGNLDSKTSDEICSLIHRLNKTRGLTFVIVTHEPSLAEKATRVLHIRDGKLERDVIARRPVGPTKQSN